MRAQLCTDPVWLGGFISSLYHGGGGGLSGQYACGWRGLLVKELAQCSVEVIDAWVGGRVSLAKAECSLGAKCVDIHVLECSACNNSLFPFRRGEVEIAVNYCVNKLYVVGDANISDEAFRGSVDNPVEYVGRTVGWGC